jgi:RHS repeat-associated protein
MRLSVCAPHRRVATSVTDGVVGTFAATYDPNGRLSTQVYPGSTFAAIYHNDEVGNATALTYFSFGGTWPDLHATYNIHGEQLSASDYLESFAYGYDAAGRLTQTNDTQQTACAQRNYTFDADTNRTQLVVRSGGTTGSGGPCPPTQIFSTKTSAYDSADRATTTGYSYDAFGRTTAIPATDTPAGLATTVGYYTNDLVNTITTNATTLTYLLDPNRRVRTFTSSADNQTHTNHYSADSDSPAWTAENTAGTTWTRNITAFAGLAATTTNTGATTYPLANLHGDIFSTVPSTATNWTASETWTATDEYGAPETNGQPVGTRYDYLGTHQRQRDTNSGLQLMGARLYNNTTGRFLQTDPILGGSANNYDYTAGDPINGRDLDGRCKHHHWWDHLKCPGNDGWSGVGHIVVDYVSNHWRTWSVVATAAACFFVTFGTCAGLVLTAWIFRSVATLTTHGLNARSFRAIAIDGLIAWGTLAVVGAAIFGAASPWYARVMGAFLDSLTSVIDTWRYGH